MGQSIEQLSLRIEVKTDIGKAREQVAELPVDHGTQTKRPERPSHVIAAMKPGPAARQSIRFSLGTETTTDEISDAITAVQRCVSALGAWRENWC